MPASRASSRPRACARWPSARMAGSSRQRTKARSCGCGTRRTVTSCVRRSNTRTGSPPSASVPIAASSGQRAQRAARRTRRIRRSWRIRQERADFPRYELPAPSQPFLDLGPGERRAEGQRTNRAGLGRRHPGGWQVGGGGAFGEYVSDRGSDDRLALRRADGRRRLPQRGLDRRRLQPRWPAVCGRRIQRPGRRV